MIGVIYKYTNKLNNRVYIGQTIYENERKKAHFVSSADSKFHRAIHYYGWINFDYEVIEKVEQSKLSERELYWIKYYDSVNNGYNTKSKSLTDALEKRTEIIRNGLGVRLPFGYEYRNKDRNIYINEKEAEIIKNMFNDYVSGYSYKELKNKYDKTCWTILKNKKYIGDSKFPQIISEEIFNKVQDLIYNAKRKKRRKGIKCIIDGVEYNNASIAAEKTGIKYKVISNRIRKLKVNSSLKEILYKGHCYTIQ